MTRRHELTVCNPAPYTKITQAFGSDQAMKRLLVTTTALFTSATVAQAGGLERTTQSPAILFEDGRYFELSFGTVSPDVTGGAAALGGESGDMLASYSTFGVAFKSDINETLSYAVIFDQPYGADTAYHGTFIPMGSYAFAGASAEVNSNAITGILQYNIDGGASVYGGLRAQSLQAEAQIPFLGGYSISSNTDYQLGYMAGVAYERPEIALRVALTYHSEIEHDLELTEASPALLAPGGPETNTNSVSMPQSLNLEFQSGVAENTLAFGSIRWVEWSETVIDPTVYRRAMLARPLVFFEDDRITYTLGVARRRNETWSVLGSLGYEESTGSETGNLGPTDGFKSISLGAVYTKDNMKSTGGVRYVDIGDATTFSGAEFSDNNAIAAGIRVGWSF